MKALCVLLLLCAPLSAADLTYDEIVRLIQSQHLTSVEQLLPKLPEEFRANYSLMHHSRSLQKATYENPRVILFGRNAKLTCAFNGDGDTLECFQFVDATRSFDFRLIRFPTRENGLERPTFSPSNETACTKCHAADPRPNWNHYSIWEGAYGSDDDELDQEFAAYASFTRKRAEHPRYRWLVQGPYDKDPYMDLKAGRTDIGHRPNIRFSDAVGHLNALRTRRILESKVTKAESVAFALRALQCPLSPEQKARLPELAAIFKKVGVGGGAWTTQIFDDPLTELDHPWEHQSGFGYLSLETAMAVVQDEAFAGDAVFKDALEKMHAYYERRYAGVEREFRQIMNQIVLDPDTFGGHFTENTGYVCPRLIELYGQPM